MNKICNTRNKGTAEGIEIISKKYGGRDTKAVSINENFGYALMNLSNECTRNHTHTHTHNL